MIGTSLWESIFIQICIVGLHYLAPLCVSYTLFVFAVYGFHTTAYRFPLIVEVIALAETLFYLLGYLPYSAYLQRDAKHPPAPSRAERRHLYELCNENIPDVEAYIQKWFLGAPREEIKRENLKEFFLWAFFNRGGPPGDDDEELEEYITDMEKLIDRKIDPGRGNAVCLRLTLDKGAMLHRSLIWYWCVFFVDFLTYINLSRHGFHFHRTSHVRFFKLFPFRPQTLFARKTSPVTHTTYWHRQHTSKTRLPVLFIHGIGIGLYPYTSFLSEIDSVSRVESSDPTDQVGVIAIELMPVSFRITDPTLRKEAMCAEILAILNHHGWLKCVLVSHSYGTVVSTHLLKDPSTSPRIGPVVLIDPVSILLHLPDVAYNFTRRIPRKANEHQLYYFASMDIGVSHTLSRHFFWNENVLWKEDLGGRDVTVSLAGCDLIVNTEAVGRYLTSEEKDAGRKWTDEMGARGEKAEVFKHREWKATGINVIWFDALDHAQIFDSKATRMPVINVIRAYCDEK